MGWWNKLLSWSNDPTADWPGMDLNAPGVDLSNMSFGPLRFGDDLEAAQALGRPDRFTGNRAKYCELLYARCGFQIDFEKGRFCYLAFFIGQDEHQPKHPALIFSQPKLAEDVKLTQGTRIADIKNLFGDPVSENVDSDETILFYMHNGITMEFELTNSGHLKRWNLYPKK